MLRFFHNLRISDHLYWEHLEDFLKPIKQFINAEIDGEEFRCEFFKIWRQNRDYAKMMQKDLKFLKNFKPNPKSLHFSPLTADLFQICDLFYSDEDSDLREINQGLNENQLRLLVIDALSIINEKYI